MKRLYFLGFVLISIVLAIILKNPSYFSFQNVFILIVFPIIYAKKIEINPKIDFLLFLLINVFLKLESMYLFKIPSFKNYFLEFLTVNGTDAKFTVKTFENFDIVNIIFLGIIMYLIALVTLKFSSSKKNKK